MKENNDQIKQLITEDLSELLKDTKINGNGMKLESYDQLEAQLLEQSHSSQAAIEDIERIEQQDLFTDNSLTSLDKLSDHLSSAFKQVDQLEELINFVDNKANALDAKMAALEKEQNEWMKENK